jgi:hypothetical protein
VTFTTPPSNSKVALEFSAARQVNVNANAFAADARG